MMDATTINDAATMRGGLGSVLGRIDQYELVRELGGGGFGTVYLAKDTVAGIDVAVKGLPPMIKNNAEELERIRENFALVSRLHHPYIAAALHLQLARDVAYRDESVRQKLRVMPGDTLMVMEYAPGVTLTKWRRQFPGGIVPLDVAIQLAWQIAQALDYAHEQHIIHRDIKPSNIMVETKPDGEVVARLLDFGLAAAIRSSMGRVSQEVHDTSGTRPYMAPEQWAGRKQGPATDQYALAVLLCELLTGEVPFASAFETGDPIVMMTAVCNREVELPNDCPRKAALRKALAKDSSGRFASCMEFVEEAAKSERATPQGGGKQVAPTPPQGGRRQVAIRESCVQVLRKMWKNAWIWLVIVVGAVAVIFCSFFWREWPTRQFVKACKEKKYEAAAKLIKLIDCNDAEAQNCLGLMYKNGHGVAKNEEEAVKWYRKAAEKGNAKAQVHLGFMYQNGDGVGMDKVKAVEWYHKAADQGLDFAQCMLGACYEDGEGVEKSYVDALKWYRKAAEQGLDIAQNILGELYANGKGVEKDEVAAVKWYRKAAEQGEMDAQYRLGLMYEEGRGVGKDEVEAVKWYRKAAAQGNKRAQENLKRLEVGNN